MTDREHATDGPGTSLSDIEPIRSTAQLGEDGSLAPDDMGEIDRVGRNAAATMGSTPAVGVTAEVDEQLREERQEPNEEVPPRA